MVKHFRGININTHLELTQIGQRSNGHLDLIDYLVETRNYSMLSLASVASSLGSLKRINFIETGQSGPPSFFRMFSLLLKKLTFIF